MRNRQYEVQEILDYRNKRGIREYQIKWKGYLLDQCTWEPQENLTCCGEMLHQFKAEVGLGFQEEDSAAEDNYKPKSRENAVRREREDNESKTLTFLQAKGRKQAPRSFERRSPQKQRELFIYEQETAPHERQSSEQQLANRKTKKSGKADTLQVTKMLIDENQDVYFQVQEGGQRKTMKRGELLEKDVLAVLKYYQKYYHISNQSMWT